MALKYIGGVEGGATRSNLAIMDSEGRVVASARGPGTNHWQLGLDECAARIVAMVHAAKADAGIPLHTPLDALGLTLSGCEQETTDKALAERVAAQDANCARVFYVGSDTTGSLATAAPDGGMVLIAGTGSNALLKNYNGDKFGCGGWGHILGDEGSAYWIARRAVKAVLDDADGLRPAPHPVPRLWAELQRHFGVTARHDLLPHAYSNFNKSQFAGVTEHLSKLAAEGDDMCAHVLAAAGRELGLHVAALAPRHVPAPHTPHTAPAALRVVCVGSVFRSWPLLEAGAMYEVARRRTQTPLQLVRLRVSSALGAAHLAAESAGLQIPRDDAAYCRVFYSYQPTDPCPQRAPCGCPVEDVV